MGLSIQLRWVRWIVLVLIVFAAGLILPTPKTTWSASTTLSTCNDMSAIYSNRFTRTPLWYGSWLQYPVPVTKIGTDPYETHWYTIYDTVNGHTVVAYTEDVAIYGDHAVQAPGVGATYPGLDPSDYTDLYHNADTNHNLIPDYVEIIASCFDVALEGYFQYLNMYDPAAKDEMDTIKTMNIDGVAHTYFPVYLSYSRNPADVSIRNDRSLGRVASIPTTINQITSDEVFKYELYGEPWFPYIRTTAAHEAFHVIHNAFMITNYGNAQATNDPYFAHISWIKESIASYAADQIYVPRCNSSQNTYLPFIAAPTPTGCHVPTPLTERYSDNRWRTDELYNRDIVPVSMINNDNLLYNYNPHFWYYIQDKYVVPADAVLPSFFNRRDDFSMALTTTGLSYNALVSWIGDLGRAYHYYMVDQYLRDIQSPYGNNGYYETPAPWGGDWKVEPITNIVPVPVFLPYDSSFALLVDSANIEDAIDSTGTRYYEVVPTGTQPVDVFLAANIDVRDQYLITALKLVVDPATSLPVGPVLVSSTLSPTEDYFNVIIPDVNPLANERIILVVSDISSDPNDIMADIDPVIQPSLLLKQLPTDGGAVFADPPIFSPNGDTVYDTTDFLITLPPNIALLNGDHYEINGDIFDPQTATTYHLGQSVTTDPGSDRYVYPWDGTVLNAPSVNFGDGDPSHEGTHPITMTVKVFDAQNIEVDEAVMTTTVTIDTKAPSSTAKITYTAGMPPQGYLPAEDDTLVWDAVAPDGSPGSVTYWVYRSSTPITDVSTLTPVHKTQDTRYAYTGGGATQYFAILTVDAAGNQSVPRFAESNTAKIDVMILIDGSSSAAAKYPDILTGVTTLISGLETDDRVGFSRLQTPLDHPFALVDDEHKSVLIEHLQTTYLSGGGDSDATDALTTTLQLLTSQSLADNGRPKTIILYTDGYWGSPITFDLAAMLNEHGITLIVLQYYDGCTVENNCIDFGPLTSTLDDPDSKTYALYSTTSLPEIEGIFDEIAVLLRGTEHEIFTDKLDPGVTKAYTYELDSHTRQTNITIQWGATQPQPLIELTNPAGTKKTVGAATFHGVEVAMDATTARIFLTTPPASYGTWTVHVTNNGGPLRPDGTRSTEAPLDLGMTTLTYDTLTSSLIYAAESQEFQYRLADYGMPVDTRGSVSLTITDTHGLTQTLLLEQAGSPYYRDGAIDGLFTGTLALLPGAYTVTTQYVGSSLGEYFEPLQRIDTRTISIHPTVSAILPQGILEGTSVPVTLTLSMPLSYSYDITYWTEDGTAVGYPSTVITDWFDYRHISYRQANSNQTRWTTFDAGQTTKVITLTTYYDRDLDPHETFNLVIGTRHGTMTRSKIQILDNIAVGALISVAPLVEVLEGDIASITVTLDTPQPIDYVLDYWTWTEEGTATSSTDYTPIPHTQLVFAPGEVEKTILFPTREDGIEEVDRETMTIRITDTILPYRYDADSLKIPVVILDDDLPVVKIFNRRDNTQTPASELAMTEGTTKTLRVQGENLYHEPMTVGYTVTALTADRQTDYTAPLTGALEVGTWSNGNLDCTQFPQECGMDVVLAAQRDTTIEGPETFQIDWWVRFEDGLPLHQSTATVLPFTSTLVTIAEVFPVPVFSSTVAITSSAQHVNTGDLNGDGYDDLVVLPSNSSTLHIMLNDTNGMFVPLGSPLTVGSGPRASVLGDLNRDGTLDIVVVTTNNLNNASSYRVLLGDGAGGFTIQSAQSLGVGDAPDDLVLADINRDSWLDLVIANTGSDSVRILIGNKLGAFIAAKHDRWTVGNEPRSVLVRDLNHNGLPDLVTSNQLDGTLTILWDLNADGYAAHQQTLLVAPTALSGAWNVKAADFNHDGALDLVVSNPGSDTVSLLFATAPGVFATPVPYAVDDSPHDLTLDDFDSNGSVDVLVTHGASGHIQPLLNVGDGRLSAVPALLASNSTHSPMTGDFNHDGRRDLLVAHVAHPHLTLYHSLLDTSAGTFLSAQTYTTEMSESMWTPFNPAIGDINEDGHPDLVVPYRDFAMLEVFLGNGRGAFTPTWQSDWNTNYGYLFGLKLADMNRDGHEDAVMIFRYGRIGIALGTGNGTFGNPVTYQTPDGGVSLTSSFLYDLEVHDLNRDGFLDVAVVDNALHELVVLLGSANGTLSVHTRHAITNGGHSSLTVGDENRDGIPDLLITLSKGYSVWWLIGTGDGTFPTLIPVMRSWAGSIPCYGASDASVHDIDDDGDLEVLVLCPGTGVDPTVAPLDQEYLYIVDKVNGVYTPQAPINVSTDAAYRDHLIRLQIADPDIGMDCPMSGLSRGMKRNYICC